MINKMIKYLLLVLFLPLVSLAQGINFEKESWQKTIAKAQKQKKLIFVQVGANWSGESKQMAQLALQHKDVATYFNENFINFLADGEDGDGKAIATRYAVKGYPTQLFIQPNNQELIAKFTGYADAQQLKQRAEKAKEAHADTKSWTQYNQEYAKHKKDKTFITAYLKKGTYIDANIDHAIDDYLTYQQPEVNKETILFLTDHIKTLNNKGVDLIVNLYKDLPDGINMLDQWLPSLYDNTYDEAIAKKNPNLLKRIVWASEQTDNKQAQAIYLRFLGSYHLQLKDYNNYWKIADQQISAYMQHNIAYYRHEDSLAYAALVDNYKTQLKAYGVPEKDYDSYINETLKDKVEAQYQSSYMSASNINEILNIVLEHGKGNKDILQKASSWSKFMMDLVEPLTFEWSYFGITAADILRLQGNTEGAKAVLQKGIEKAKGNKQVIKLLEDELAK